MKIPLIILTAALPLKAQIFADVTTSKGDFTIELHYSDTPRTVANFITLAEGSRSWVDSRSGKVQTNTPFYDGITFHRVLSGFVNQTGSKNGTGSDSIGYLFPDEVSNGRLHDVPYVVSMANSGPNTNSAQFFITVGGAKPWLDGKHTVFGIVSSGTSVVDDINSSSDTESILSVKIRKVGAPAIAFDEHSQDLPIVSPLNECVSLKPGSVNLNITQTIRSSVQAYQSQDLISWSPVVNRLIHDNDSSQMGWDISTTSTGLDHTFYYLSKTDYPSDAVFPSNMSNRTFVLNDSDNSRIFTFVFANDGVTGTWSLDNPALSGAITTSTFLPTLYGGMLGMQLTGITFNFVLVKIGLDEGSSGNNNGRHDSRFAQNAADLNAGIPFSPVIDVLDTYEITTP